MQALLILHGMQDALYPAIQSPHSIAALLSLVRGVRGKGTASLDI